jgi:glycosyltransferase involved in cell wall biosynthesis
VIESVLIVTDKAFISGGQAKVAIDTAILLAKKGLDVTFFAPVGPADQSLSASGVRVECLGQPDILGDSSRVSAMVRGLWNREAAKALSRLVDGLDPERSIIHCHGYAKALSPAIGPVLASSRVPSLFTMHEYFLACPNGGFFDYPANRICERRPLGMACLTRNCDSRRPIHKAWRVVRQAVTWGPGRMPSGLRNISYLSEVQLAAMRPYLPAGANLYALPNPIKLPEDARLAAGTGSRDFVFVGRLNPEKGGHVFAEAARRANVRAVFIGDGPERARIEALNPEAVVTGWKRPEEVREIMLGARALVFPSLWYETFGLVAHEAIACGLPVVCGRRNAAAEAILPGKNGLVLDSMDPDKLTEALVALSDDEHPVFREIRKPEHRKVSTEEAYLDRLLDIYETVCSATPRAANAS